MSENTAPAQQPLDTELLDAKPIKALRKEIGDGAIKEFICLSDEALKAVMTTCFTEIDDANRQTKKVPAYRDAEVTLKDFKDALRDKNRPLQKRLKAAAYILGTRKEARRG